MKKIKIDNKSIGDEEACFLIAEISANHLQKKDNAFKLIEEAKSAGADAVKFQTYTPNTITIKSNKEYFKIKGTIWKGKTLYDLYSKAYTPWDWFPELKDRAKQAGLIFFSTPYDRTAVDFLERLKVPLYKVASFEVNDIPLIKYIASKKKPVLFSTGVSTLSDIELAVSTIKAQGNNDIVILKCVSGYPTPFKELNLKTIQDIIKRFNAIPGLSDHTLGISVVSASVVLGAKVIEKHLILDRKMGGPDAPFSLEPSEFKQMVDAVREAEDAIGEVNYELTEKAKEHRIFMKSIFAVENIKKGEVLTEKNIRVIRPGHGLHPKYYESILGSRVIKNIEKGTPLDWGLVENKHKKA